MIPSTTEISDMDERHSIRNLQDWTAYEGRAWYSAWADRGLALEQMSPDAAAAVRNLDRTYAVIVDDAAAIPEAAA